MNRRFEMREVGTRRLLGTIETIEAMAPGAVVLMFRDDLVQVDVPPPAPVTDGPGVAALVADPSVEAAPPARKRKPR